MSNSVVLVFLLAENDRQFILRKMGIVIHIKRVVYELKKKICECISL